MNAAALSGYSAVVQIAVHPLSLTKRYPLTISRGTSAASENLLVAVTENGVTSVGEFAPVGIGAGVREDAATARAALSEWKSRLEDVSPFEMQKVEAVFQETGDKSRAAFCALETALHDWVGKSLRMSVFRLLSGDVSRIAPTSVTIGINPPDVVRERIPELMARLNPRSLKIKLGSPAGLDADREMFAVVSERTPPGVAVRVDANGGWSVDGARAMMRWLAERGVEYVEQPLARGQEADLPAVLKDRPLPVFADESCRVAADVPRLAALGVDGVNLKLMKAGGIREGLRVIHAARAHGLQVMMGCMSESSLAIAASVALSPYADHLDLDSHLNLLPDPFTGLSWTGGRVLPSDTPGLGVERNPA